MSRYKRMLLSTLKIDERYQRPLDAKRVQKIVREFDARRFGVLEISQRNGKAAVFDGQHRLAAAQKLGHKDVPCLIHSNLAPEEEAELFIALQRERRGINQVDQFKARCFMGDELAQDMAAIVDRCGFQIRADGSNAGQLRSIRAITSLERIYERGILEETLYLLNDLWGGDPKSTDGGLLEGLALIVEGYGHRLEGEPMDRLREAPPLVILRRAIGHSGGGSVKGKFVANEIRKVAGLRGAARKTQVAEPA
jgi:hypothetical protein